MEKKYPIGGYAPGDYWHKACKTCGNDFIGDKRAWNCEPCGEKLAIEKSPQTDPYQPLFDHMHQEHGLTLLESEMADIIHLVEKMQPPTGAVWVKGSPKSRKLYHARFKGNIDNDLIYDGIIEPVPNPVYWQAIASGVRISIKAHHIIEYLDESVSPTKKSDAVDILEFAEWAAEIAWFDEEYHLWNFYEEGKMVDGRFRFSTSEFYQLFKQSK